MNDRVHGKITLLVVDDEDEVRRQIFWMFRNDHEVLQAASREEAIAQLKSAAIDVVLCDLHLTRNGSDTGATPEGLDVIAAARSITPPVPVIVITGSSSRRNALEAIKRGAYGFFEKPFEADEVAHVVNQAARVRRMEQELCRLRSELSGDKGLSRLIGGSNALDQTIKQARTVAATSATVLLTGENGTGKELLAHAIHEDSPRAGGPFIAVSCAALPETLIESELFGHERGAYTGALFAKKGRFELADGGTLFLDEISELSPAVQVKLLRVLQEREFERLGGTKTLTVDIRLIAATNRDLEEDITTGRFRADLFYRLNVVPLRLPPLRERHEDIPLLAAHFVAKACDKHSRPMTGLSNELLEALQEHEWPGNVRELENLMERLVVLSPGGTLGIESLPEKMLRVLPSAATGADETTLEGAMISLKKRMVHDALQQANGNRTLAAERLGISRSYIHRLLSEFEQRSVVATGKDA